jgi:phosphatidylglycerophosphate synthase
MIELYIRPLYQRLLGNRLAQILGKILSPNIVTLLAVLVGIAIIPALIYNQVTLALVFLGFSGLLDGLDGSIARLYQKSSAYGTALDITGDRIVEFAIILGLFLISPEARGFDCLMMLGSILICVTSFLVVGIFSENDSHKGFHYSPGIIERLEAFIFFAAMIFFFDLFPFLAQLFSILVFLTAFLRLSEFKRQVQHNTHV